MNNEIYYMRDNHTFVPISYNLDDAINKIKEEFKKGYTYGTLFELKNRKNFIHAKGNLEEFLDRAIPWLIKTIEES